MKIYILADMEGISGIRQLEQTQKTSGEYAEGRRLMMGDVNTAIAAAFDAGASEVVACDTHGGGGQFLLSEMDRRAAYETPGNGLLMPSLDATYAGVMLLGHHAKAGTLNGFLDHTMSSESWFDFRLNGQSVGEIAIEAAYAGHFNVPVLIVSGDEATAFEARELLGEVECAVVKKGIGRNRAHCLSIPEAHERIRAAVLGAMGSIGRFRPWRPSLPASIELTFYRSDMADPYANRPGITRIDARTVRGEVMLPTGIMTALR